MKIGIAYTRDIPQKIYLGTRRPRKILVEFVKRKLIEKGKALDIYCGAGTNAIYLVKKGFFKSRVLTSPTKL